MAVDKVVWVHRQKHYVWERPIFNQNKYLLQYGQRIVVSTEKVVQCSQSAIRSLAGHPGEWYHIWGSVLISAIGRSGTQHQLLPGQPWWVRVHVIESMHNPISATMATWFIGTLNTDRDGWERGWLSKGWVILCPWLLNSSSAGSPFDEHPHGTEVSLYPLLIWRD